MKKSIRPFFRALGGVFLLFPMIACAQKGYTNNADDTAALTSALVAAASGNGVMQPATYYIRTAMQIGNVAGWTNLNSKSFTVANAGKVRIIGGIGVGSSRWKLMSQQPSDPWYSRLPSGIGYSVYMVDVADELGIDAENIDTIPGGWSKISSGSQAPNTDPLGASPYDDVEPATAGHNAYEPTEVNNRSAKQPWTASLDYQDPTNGWTEGKPLSYAMSTSPETNRTFKWLTTPSSGASATSFAVSDWQQMKWPTSGSYGNQDVQGFEDLENNDLRCLIFPYNDWRPLNAAVQDINVVNHTISLKPNLFASAWNSYNSSSTTTFSNQQRFVLLNAPEFLANPGDMVVNYDLKRIYFIPFVTPPTSGPEHFLNVSVPKTTDASNNYIFRAPLSLKNVKNTKFEGFDVETCMGEGVYVANSDDSTIGTNDVSAQFTGCEFRNIGGASFSGRSTTQLRVTGCNFRHGLSRHFKYTEWPEGADEPNRFKAQVNMTKKGNLLDQNFFETNGLISPYSPVVELTFKTSGFTIKLNDFIGSPGQAIRLFGSQINTLWNYFYRSMTEITEFGVVYTGNTLVDQGNKIYQNLFKKIYRCSDIPTRGTGLKQYDDSVSCVMIDDGACGQEVRGNHFYYCHGKIQSNGGRYNLFVYNKVTDDPNDSRTTKNPNTYFGTADGNNRFFGSDTFQDSVDGDPLRFQHFKTLLAFLNCKYTKADAKVPNGVAYPPVFTTTAWQNVLKNFGAYAYNSSGTYSTSTTRFTDEIGPLDAIDEDEWTNDDKQFSVVDLSTFFEAVPNTSNYKLINKGNLIISYAPYGSFGTKRSNTTGSSDPGYLFITSTATPSGSNIAPEDDVWPEEQN